MTVLNTRALAKFARKHRDASAAMDRWVEAARRADWNSIIDVRKTFATADGVPTKIKGGGMLVAIVFNIKGNEYRLITVIDYRASRIIVQEVLTHGEYTRDAWKERL
jgi:mRNA interferase HigB